MSFKIEETKTGKPCIVFNNTKYRQHRTLKNGDISWRCLGRDCGATVKTDADVKTITVCNIKHSGPHPATMRQLMSPHQTSSVPASPASPSTSGLPASSTSLATPSTSTFTPTLVVSMPAPISLQPTALSTSQRGPSTNAVSLEYTNFNLTVENKLLKEKICKLNERVTDLLNHSIESDTRLLQYTDQVFVAIQSSLSQTSASRANQNARASASVDSGVQCEPTELATVKVDCAVQCEPPTIKSNVCEMELCKADRDLVRSLKTTIEVLEAEIECFRLSQHCGLPNDNDTWTKVQSKKLDAPVEVKNKFKPLISRKTNSNNLPSKPRPYCANTVLTKKHPRRQQQVQLNQTIGNRQQKIKQSLSYRSVVIRGDSHARHVAGLLRELIDSEVTGICKPGAKLANILEPNSSSSQTGAHCEVLTAGTNDLAVGESHNIYSVLESYITSRPANTRLIISTIPHRHDLTKDDDINQETALVNAYIEELTARHNISLLDFAKLDRRMFTRHGMHLSRRGKRQLAVLIQQCLATPPWSKPSSTPPPAQSPPPSEVTSSQPAAIPGPVTIASCETRPVESCARTLPCESYAEATKISLGENVISNSKNVNTLPGIIMR